MMQTWITTVAQLIQNCLMGLLMCCRLVMKHFCSWCLLMGARGGCQKLNKRTQRFVFFLTDDEAMQSFPHTFVQCTQNNGTWTEVQELAMPVNVTVCFCLISMQETLLTKHWPNCSYHWTLIRFIEGSKLTVVVVDGQLMVVKKYFELFMAVKADRTQNAKQFNPQLLLFSSSSPSRTTCKAQCKGWCTPKSQSGVSLHEWTGRQGLGWRG